MSRPAWSTWMCRTSLCQQLQTVDDCARRLRPGQLAHGSAHLGPFGAVLRESRNGRRHVLGAGRALVENQRRADARELRCILALMIVGGGGQRNEDGRSEEHTSEL